MKKIYSKVIWLLLIVIIILLICYTTASIIAANALTTTSYHGEADSLTPHNYGLPFEEIAFTSAATDKITLRGWWVPAKAATHVLIMLPGRDATRVTFLPFSKPLWDKGYSMLMLDSRANGKSDGERFSYGQNEQWDIMGAVNFVKAKGYQPGNIGILGWSMGASSAIMGMQASPDIRAGVMDSPYGDLSRVADKSGLGFLYPGITTVSRFLWGLDIDQVKPETAIKNLGSCHVFLIHGDQDTTVPVSETYALQKAGGSTVKQVWIVPGVPHVGAYGNYPDQYVQRLLTFFDQELPT